MYKKIGFCMFLIILMHSGCETEGVFKPSSSSSIAVQRCIDSGGVFDFDVDNRCVCGEMKCDDHDLVCDANLIKCVECFGNEVQCYEECDDEGKCTNYIRECQNDNKWKRTICPYGCDSKKLTCFECESTDDDNEFKCLSEKSRDDNYEGNNNTSQDNNENDISNTPLNGDSTMINDGHIYQCTKGYYKLKETCAYGCSNDKLECKDGECIDGDKKCLEDGDGDNAVVLTCKNGFWPTKGTGTWEEQLDQEVIEISNYPYCHPEKAEAVECNQNLCVNMTADKFGELECERSKYIVLGFMKELSKLDDYTDFNNKLDRWFKLKTSEVEDSICDYWKSETVADCLDKFEEQVCAADWKLSIVINNNFGVIQTCNNNKLDVHNVTPCLNVEYTEPSGDEPPKYNVIFTPKGCANPPEGAKYSNACAINSDTK